IRCRRSYRLTPQDQVACVFFMGAPTVFEEKIHNGMEIVQALRRVEQETGVTFSALVAGEIGGCNALEPLIASAITGLPVVDADGMGRAFPELQMVTFFIYDGLRPDTAALADAAGRTAVCTTAQTPKQLEDMFRKECIGMGCTAGVCFGPMDAEDVIRTGILGSVSLAYLTGNKIMEARVNQIDPFQKLEEIGWTKLFEGKVVNVERITSEGFARGFLEIKELSFSENDDNLLEVNRTVPKRTMRIDFQNENLQARIIEGVSETDWITVALVPDLITVAEVGTARPVATEEARFGLRCCVLARAAPAALRTPTALEVVGPKAFGIKY
ncbi:unnamed protein product, partial [Heterosigma akashiwo]